MASQQTLEYDISGPYDGRNSAATLLYTEIGCFTDLPLQAYGMVRWRGCRI
jgi:hypothetical protein